MPLQLYPVLIAGTGSFLPNDPIPSNKIDDILGPLDGAPKRVRTFIEGGGGAMLGESCIETRHFAIDPETRNLTHTIADLAEEAARKALEAANMQPNEIDLLLLSAPSSDYSAPPTSTILQEELGIELCAEMEIHSNCSGVGKCMQVAFDALRTGRYRTALITYAQLSSVYLRSCYFNLEKITKTQAALRYILSDGSGAVVLKAVHPGEGPVEHELIGTHVESVGGNFKPAMTCGGAAADLIEWDNQIPEMYEKGLHHLNQDLTAVTQNAGRRLMEGSMRMALALGLDPTGITHHVGSIPTRQLYEDNIEMFKERFSARADQMQFRAQKTGYCGGASILLHFDEMVRTGEIKSGDLVLVNSVESSKWMCAGFVVKW